MGFLSSFKRWLNHRDAYGQLRTLNRGSFMVSKESADSASKAMYTQLNEVDDEPSESLPDVELDRSTSREAIAKREAAMEHERHIRESRQ